MKASLILTAVLLLSPVAGWAAGSDALADQSIALKLKDPDAALDSTIANLKEVFQRYQVALNAGASLSKPLRVGGSNSSPVITMTFEKCFLGMLCETVPFRGEMSIRDSRGNCDRNMTLETDLSGSGDLVKNNYRKLEVDFCYKRTDAGATLAIRAVAIRASTYASGLKQNEVLKLLRLQVKPMVAALKRTIESNDR